MSATERPAPKRWNLNGIPVFQADVPGRIRAGLEFRVGTADEPLPMAGVTHLIQHLALSGLGQQPYEYSGFVDQTHTGFFVSGTGEQVIEFFSHVTAALRSLPLDRVGSERRTIEAEAAGHHQSSARGSLSLRFGATGYGTADYRQIGLLWLTPEAVRWWAVRSFTADNAAAWVAGPIIPRLMIDLPRGARLGAPALTPKRLQFPCVAEVEGPGAMASMIAARSTALWAGLRIVERRAVDRIRSKEGLSCGVQTTIQQLDGRTVHALAATDAPPEQVTRAAAALLDVADLVSLTGPGEEEIRQVADGVDEELADPESLVGEMQRMARDELLGVPLSDLAGTRDTLLSLTPAAVASALRDALASLIVIVPPGARSPRPRFPPYAFLEAHPLPGTEVAHAVTSDLLMIVGPSGISMCDAERRASNISWQDVAAGARWEDGSVLLIGRDGTAIVFRPLLWSQPSVVLDAIDAYSPADRMVPADGPSPSSDLPLPPEDQRSATSGAGRARDRGRTPPGQAALSSPKSGWSHDRNWFWDGMKWNDAVSPDGTWRFDGKRWQPFSGLRTPMPGEALAPPMAVPPAQSDLVDRPYWVAGSEVDRLDQEAREREEAAAHAALPAIPVPPEQDWRRVGEQMKYGPRVRVYSDWQVGAESVGIFVLLYLLCAPASFIFIWTSGWRLRNKVLVAVLTVLVIPLVGLLLVISLGHRPQR